MRFRQPRLLVIVLAVLLSLAAVPVRAERESADWSWDDPIVSVGGRLIDIQVQMPSKYLLTMRSTTLLVIIPSNVRGVVVLDDISAFPMDTMVRSWGPAWDGKGDIPITIVATVVAKADYDIRIVAKPVLNLSSPVQPLLGSPLSLLAAPLARPTIAYGRSSVPLVMPMRLAK
ncbi:MAG: hypothetical protein HYX51_04235 [Chloroflexi bacterium]|nr:hypothetical protein [Chloroflexota bacterium]